MLGVQMPSWASIGKFVLSVDVYQPLGNVQGLGHAGSKAYQSQSIVISFQLRCARRGASEGPAERPDTAAHETGLSFLRSG